MPGFTTVDSGRPGPHVVVTALMHGNELAGAIVLDAMLRAGVTLQAGRLTLGFANLDAFRRFDPAHPTASRFVDEDLNRVWDPALLDGPRRSSRAGPGAGDAAADRHGGRAAGPALDAVAVRPADR